jgi:hypothetical protein
MIRYKRVDETPWFFLKGEDGIEGLDGNKGAVLSHWILKLHGIIIVRLISKTVFI